MARDDKRLLGRATSLPLENAQAQIEWLAPPSQDVLARLLLELIGESDFRRIIDG